LGGGRNNLDCQTVIELKGSDLTNHCAHLWDITSNARCCWKLTKRIDITVARGQEIFNNETKTTYVYRNEYYIASFKLIPRSVAATHPGHFQLKARCFSVAGWNWWNGGGALPPFIRSFWFDERTKARHKGWWNIAESAEPRRSRWCHLNMYLGTLHFSIILCKGKNNDRPNSNF